MKTILHSKEEYERLCDAYALSRHTKPKVYPSLAVGSYHFNPNGPDWYDVAFIPCQSIGDGDYTFNAEDLND